LQARGIGFSFVAVVSEKETFRKKHPEQHSSDPENCSQTL
jgi:hypothetical protein